MKTTAPNAEEVVTVDLHKEVLAMAVKNNETEADLELNVQMVRGEYYAAVVRAHYQGLDKGYANGVAVGERANRPWWFWYPLGVVTPFAVKFAYKAALFAWYIYNS